MYNTISLLKVKEIDNSYNHTYYFDCKENQTRFFDSKIVYQLNDTQYTRINQNSIQVEYNIESMENVDYMKITVYDDRGRVHSRYYFITNKFYVNENVTCLVIELDVIQTFLFDMNLNRVLSFVDRTMIKDIENGNVYSEELQEIEDLNIDHYNIISKQTIFNAEEFGKGGFFVSSSDVLGSTGSGGSGGSSSGGSGIVATESTPSQELFKFLKGYEGFSATPYQDSGGVWTIGYGVTQSHPEHYNSLLPTCTEEQASKVLGEIILLYSQGVYDYMINNGKTNIKLQELDAFTTLAYNCGIYGAKSTTMMDAYINNQPVTQNMWNSYYISDASGTVLEGLINRRNSEYNIFANNTFDRAGSGFVPDYFK